MEEAWRQAEAVLPAGTCDLSVYHYDDGPALGDGFSAHRLPAKYGARTAIWPSKIEVYGYGDSPEAALRDLIAAILALGLSK